MNEETKLILEALGMLLTSVPNTTQANQDTVNKISDMIYPKEQSLPEKTKDALSEDEQKCKCGHAKSWHFESSRNGFGCNIPHPVCNCKQFVRRGKSE